MKRVILFLFASFLFPLLTYSQIIGYTPIEDLTVCRDAVFQLSIQNTEPTALENVTLNLEFPCGITYLAGSISGGTESNISNLSAPEFSLANIPAGATVQIEMTLHAPCEVLTCIDNGAIFTNIIALVFDGGNTEITTDPYIVETPLLVIRKIDSPVMVGTKSQTLLRKVYIRNTRLGAVSNFTYTNLHDPELVLQANIGTDVSPDDQTLRIELSDSDFSSFGDGDDLFEFNEELVLIEEVFINACAFDQTSLFSEIFVNWGCDGSSCANPLPNQLAVVKIELNPNTGPVLEFAGEANDPTCYCSDNLVEQSMTIVNTDPSSFASEVFIRISQATLGGTYINTPIKLVTGNDTTLLEPDFISIKDQDCIENVEAYSTMNITIPEIPPLSVAQLYWNTLFCEPAECQSVTNLWRYDWSYRKDCAQQGDVFFTSETSTNVSSEFSSFIQAGYTPFTETFMDGEFYNLQYAINSYLVDDTTGTLETILSIPCGAEIQPNDWLLGTQAPISVDFQTQGIFTNVILNYELPLDQEIDTIDIPIQFLCSEVCVEVICIDSFITTCTDLCGGVDLIILFESETTLNIADDCPDGCRPQICTRTTFNYECDVEVCYDTIPGYAEITHFSFERTNFGIADTNDDFIPDPGDPLDFNNIRVDRALTGDTLELQFSSLVHIDWPDSVFANGRIFYNFMSGCTSPNFPPCNSAALISPGGLDNFSNVLEIYDASSNLWYTCNQVPQTTDEQFGYAYDISTDNLSSCGIPLDFRYDEGDSLKLVSRYKINYNLAYVNTLNYVNPRTASITSEPKIYLFNGPELTPDNTFSCGCPSQSIDITGYGINSPANIASNIPQCKEETTFGYPDDFSVNLRFGNFFPYEFRPLAQLAKWQHEIHPSFDLVNIHVENLSNNFVNIIQNATVPFSIVNGFYEADFSGLIPDLLDETFTVKLVLEYQTKPCGLEELQVSVPRTYFYNPLPEYGIIMEAYPGNKRYNQRQPKLHLNADLCDATFFNNEVLWDFTFDNTTNSQSLESDLTAYNCWIRPISNTGAISGFNLINSETGQVYPLVNGIFQLDSLVNRDSIRVQLTGINQSCSTEDIVFEYGWSCDPFTNPIDLPCEVLELTCTATAPPGLIDMLPDPTAISALLCDTMPWLEIEVFDASLGAVYELQLEVQLPPGMSIPNGASQIAYPAQSNNFIFINDPIDLGNGRYQWTLTDALDTLTNYGLPGVNLVPENAIKLRYKTLTDCDFIAGAFPIYSAIGEQVCGIPSNKVSKLGEPINITGVSAPETTNLNISSSGNPGCEDLMSLDINITSIAPFGMNDSLVAQLPPGISYVPGSCGGTLTDCQPVINGNLLSWSLPAGQTSVDLDFQIQGFLGAGCQALSIPFYTATSINANCTSSGADCSIKTLTGSRVVPVSIGKPIFALSNFTANPLLGGSGLTDLSFDLENSGIANIQDIIVGLYIDDGDNIPGPGDTFLGNFPFSDILANGTNLTLSIPGLTIAPEDLCKLMLVVDEMVNCSCNSTFIKIQGPFVFPEVRNDTICSGQSIAIGINGNPAHNYLWETNANLSCLNCSMAQFSSINAGFDAETYRLILKEETPDNCLLQYEYLVTVQPTPSIISADETICQGATATLLASAGSTYNWTGSGISNPNAQVQMVTPMTTSTYIVEITDNFGCTGLDTVIVNVLESPTADAGLDLSNCTGVEVQLTAITQPGNTYSWSPGVPFLDDPTSPTPTVLIPQDQVYTLTVFNASCSSSDEVAVTFFDGLDLQASGNFQICEGDTAFIEISGGDNYVWTPSLIGMCQNPECSIVALAVSDSTTFSVLATTTDGCKDTIEINIEVVDEDIFNSQNIEICEGSSIEIFGISRNAEGTYCDTLSSGQSCLTVNCVNLSFSDGITVQNTALVCEGEPVDFNDATYIDPGTYCVTLTNSEGCDSTTCLTLSNFQQPEISISPDDPVIETGESVQLEASAVGISDFIWSPGIGLSCTNCADPIASPIETTLYSVEAMDLNGCINTATIEVRIENICEIQNLLIPDAFTANGNGKNDRFRISNLSPYVSSVIIEVYNRWGERVYFEEGNEGWDGTYKNENAPEAVYLYMIKAQCNGQEEKLYKGNVTLIR